MEVILFLAILGIVVGLTSVRVVPQSETFVIERFGKYTRSLPAGLNLVVPFLDKVRHKISILERQLPEFEISVITKDNVEVVLETTVFYRVVDAAKSVYRIREVDRALKTASESIVRSAGGRLELDELQSSRDSMSAEIAKNLQAAADMWGIEITRTEITDVRVDEQTKDVQRQQLNAERERRARIAKAEGDKRSVELSADATLYEAEKIADAVKIRADADAYAIKIKAAAEAEQTTVIANAIADNGQPAINYDIMKRQVDALAVLSGSSNTKTLIIPTDVTKAIGSITTLLETIDRK
jgi:regulator of protease activity HflC (stomatin/prohibitin superfamily)